MRYTNFSKNWLLVMIWLDVRAVHVCADYGFFSLGHWGKEDTQQKNPQPKIVVRPAESAAAHHPCK